MLKTTAKKALDYLETNELSEQESIRLMNILNKKINTFPLTDVIKITVDGGYMANGQKLNIDQVVEFRQGISALRDNWAFQLLADQILFLAIQHGVHFGDTVGKLHFSKASIYFITKFKELITGFDVR